MSELESPLVASLPCHPRRTLLPGEQFLSLSTNNYRFELTQAHSIFLYSISLSPKDDHADRDPIGSAMKQVRGVLRAVFGKFVRCGNVLFSKVSVTTLPALKPALEAHLAAIDPRTPMEAVFPINHEELGVTVDWASRQWTLAFKLLGSAGQVTAPESREALLQFTNIILGFVQRDLGLKQLGSCPNFFNPCTPIPVGGYPVAVWPGYFASVNQYRDGLQIRIDVAHKIVRKDTVLDFLREKARSRTEIEEELRDALIMTLYGRRLLYRVESVIFTENPLSTFERSAGQVVSYAQYYRDQYDICITDLAQPLLEVKFRNRPAVRLVPELCCMTGLSQQMRKDRAFTTSITRVLKQGPHARQNDIQAHCEKLSKAAAAQEWGLAIKDAVETRGIRMQDVTVHLGDQQSVRVRNASFSVVNKGLAAAVPISQWKVFYARQNEEEAKELVRGIKAASVAFGITVESPTPVEVTQGLKGRLETQFREALLDECRPADKFILLLLPNFLESAYGDLKKVLTVDRPLPSQVVLLSTAKKRNMSVYSKIALQIVAKLGGELWRAAMPAGVPANTMVIGIDVCHTGKSHEQSVLAFCATVNSHFTKYWNRIVFHKPRQEVSTLLAPVFSQAFKQYYKLNNKQKPQCVVIYRDGVAPGQYQALYTDELVSVIDTLKEFDRSWHPRLVIAVVNKRVNARFFTEAHENMPTGVVVEEGVVAPHYNFYMSSHSAGDGTLTPTHYNIIHDDSGLPSGVFENLTNALCFDYYNWTGGIRVPAPCQYAHKLAYLVGKHTKADLHKNLELATIQL